MRSLRRVAALAAVAGLLLVGGTGCIGRMATSGKVMKFNLEVAEGKWGRELVFLCLYIVPVYPIAGFIDLVIVNSIEFHTGTNPISGEERLARVGEERLHRGPNGEIAVSVLREDGSIDLRVTDAEGLEHFVNLKEEGRFVVARNERGLPLARVERGGAVEPLSRMR